MVYDQGIEKTLRDKTAQYGSLSNYIKAIDSGKEKVPTYVDLGLLRIKAAKEDVPKTNTVSDQTSIKASQINRSNRNVVLFAGLATFVGGVTGIVYNVKTGGGFWRGVGFYFLGSFLIAVPASLIVRNQLDKTQVK